MEIHFCPENVISFQFVNPFELTISKFQTVPDLKLEIFNALIKQKFNALIKQKIEVPDPSYIRVQERMSIKPGNVLK
jgi:hypothetical protein